MADLKVRIAKRCAKEFKDGEFANLGIGLPTMVADYIPEDCIYSKITPERIYELLDTAVACHFNCIRIWGGGYYPADVFYDYCDEHGLIVWQDFMYACNVYELTEKLRESIIE